MNTDINVGDLLHSNALGFGLVLDKNNVKPPDWAMKIMKNRNVTLNKVNQVEIFWSGGEEVASTTASHIVELIDWNSKVDTIHIVSRAHEHINDVD